ncbi:hypothetical protein LZ554_001263 [Drepanopeziza brunnea f. sp. 'monogermtubi']|nr:hypothetical protein LZ554_001263 [Drepanopeziza brunnea f. sp. 'monogermtubi']
MAPSRGFNILLRQGIWFPHRHAQRYSNFVQTATNPFNKSKVYISRSLDPYLNLSIEHYLLQKTPEDSTVLFLYTNRPSVIIGRNQNPWTEVNLGVLRNSDLGVQLVRRRSGGGTVFHDEGNVNYSVIMPTPSFDRDKHAEMVVRGLQSLGVGQARVNERHDIVVDKIIPGGGERPFKVSGSAYKLTRLRSVHHGTCLLSSPNIGSISKYLRAPAKPYIRSRGVESVSSKITNVGLENDHFEQAVVEEFGKMYGAFDMTMVNDELKDVPEIKKGFEELMSEDWIYSQTPQFEFSTDGQDGGGALAEKQQWEWPPEFQLNFTARNGGINEISLKNGDRYLITVSLKGKKLHEIKSWQDALAGPFNKAHMPSRDRSKYRARLGRAIDELLGSGGYDANAYVRD